MCFITIWINNKNIICFDIYIILIIKTASNLISQKMLILEQGLMGSQNKSTIILKDTYLSRKLKDKIARDIVFTVTWWSWVWKDRIFNEILENSENYIKPVSFTTRSMRPWEVDWIDYYFISQEKFEEMLANWEIFEHTSVKWNYYWYTNAELERIFKTWKTPICIVDEVWVKEIIKWVWDKLNVFKIFIMPPSAQELHRRLKNREIRNILKISDQNIEIEENARKDWFKKSRTTIRKAFSESIPWIRRAKTDNLYDCIVVNNELTSAIEITKQLLENALTWNLGLNK